MDSTTYIADLPPENITYQLSSMETKLKKEAIQAPMYAPLDVHKNPYMADPNNSGQQGGLQYPQVTSMKPQPPNPLPSRDIPQNTMQFQDESAQPNYIPKQKLTRDFVRENDDLTGRRLADRKRKKKRQQAITVSLQEIQMPALLALLFFLFQLPWLQALMYQYLTFVPLFHGDGIINMYGLAFKAVLFAAAYYLLNKFTEVAAVPSMGPLDDDENGYDE